MEVHNSYGCSVTFVLLFPLSAYVHKVEKNFVDKSLCYTVINALSPLNAAKYFNDSLAA